MAKSVRLLAVILVASVCHPMFAAAEEKLDYFVFLVTGKPTQGTAQEEIQKMQTAHLENFQRLAKLGELSAAGPCTDPEKNVRGIVVINAHTIADAESKFAPDPYVGQGFMKTEIHQYRPVAGKFVIPADASKLDKHVLVIFSQGEKWPNEVAQQGIVQEKIGMFAKEQHAAGGLGFAGQFGEQVNNKSPRLAVMIFRGDETSTVEKLLGEHDLVKDKAIRIQVFAQYLVKDSMPKE